MNSISNVIQGVKCCYRIEATRCRSCPYFEGHENCEDDLRDDVLSHLELLAVFYNEAEPHGADWIMNTISEKNKQEKEMRPLMRRHIMEGVKFNE